MRAGGFVWLLVKPIIASDLQTVPRDCLFTGINGESVRWRRM